MAGKQPPEPDGTYVEVALDDGQCPNCETREGITRTEERGLIQPVPPEDAGHCEACGHTDEPLAFHHEDKWAEMSDEERKQAEEARARVEARMVDYHYSAHGIASRREP